VKIASERGGFGRRAFLSPVTRRVLFPAAFRLYAFENTDFI
jgi:hypothetical protein